MIRKTPEGASTALPADGARLYAPSAERNRDVIADLVAQIAAENGQALEIASGTGQHIAAFAERCPGLNWQPTDVLPDRLASIDAYASDSAATNIAAARTLEATTPGWHATFPERQFIFLGNLLHLISTAEVQVLLSESGKALADRGKMLIYGPFKRDGQLTSEGDKSFHESLVAQDAEIGYEDVDDIIKWAASDGLHHVTTHEMPANNLALEFEKRA